VALARLRDADLAHEIRLLRAGIVACAAVGHHEQPHAAQRRQRHRLPVSSVTCRSAGIGRCGSISVP
jgi:hypothetical protein